MTDRNRFRILHCLRAPVGGLFRHVCDLAAAQSRLGHEVAVVCAATGDALTNARLDALASVLALGVHRIPMARDIGLGDAFATRHVHALAKRLAVDVIHGHGAKGGAYARLSARLLRRKMPAPLAFYTPHGGSLHYGPSSLKGRIFMALERRLETMTDGLIFESAYSAERFTAQVGPPRAKSRIIPNGVLPDEFEPIEPDADATDIVFVGELRHLKGVDVLLDALAMANRSRRITATIVGAGPDAETFKQQAATLGLDDRVRFPGALPARQAFKMGHALIMPSRAESFPYIVLEAGAAAIPMITTRVGGIPEIIGDTDTPMLAPGAVEPLTAALLDAVNGRAALAQRAQRLQKRISGRFTVDAMTSAVVDFYAAAVRTSPLATSEARRLSLTTD